MLEVGTKPPYNPPHISYQIAQIMVLYSNYICVTIKEIGGEIVKTHKYWAVGALACMVATSYTQRVQKITYIPLLQSQKSYVPSSFL